MKKMMSAPKTRGEGGRIRTEGRTRKRKHHKRGIEVIKEDELEEEEVQNTRKIQGRELKERRERKTEQKKKKRKLN